MQVWAVISLGFVAVVVYGLVFWSHKRPMTLEEQKRERERLEALRKKVRPKDIAPPRKRRP